MARDLYDKSPTTRCYFDQAKHILGFDIADAMFNGTAGTLKETNVAQPAIFLHSVVAAFATPERPDMVAGHSLGELSALVVADVLSFQEGLWLVNKRAAAMQRACEASDSTMAVVLGLSPEIIDTLCPGLSGDVVVAANYNAPEQTVISGTHQGITTATLLLKKAGAKMVMPLAVRGGFHSPLMEEAKIEFEQAVASVSFRRPTCPVYQNVDGVATEHIDKIKRNIVRQLTHPVQWTQTIRQMVEDGASAFVEFGPKRVLSGLVRRIIGQDTVSIAA